MHSTQAGHQAIAEAFFKALTEGGIIPEKYRGFIPQLIFFFP